MAKHAIIPQLLVDGGWQAIPPELLLTDAGIQTYRGYTSEGQIRPCSIAWRVNNASGAYDPDNPESPLYGQLNRNTPAAMVCGAVIDAVGEVFKWRPDQTEDFDAATGRGAAWVDIEAQGVLRRIGQWSKVLHSPMRQHISRYSNLRGYWPLEDGRAATQLTNVHSGGKPGHARYGVSFDAADGPAGGGRAVKIDAVNSMGGVIASMSATAGWQFSFTFNLSDVTLAAGTTPLMTWTSSGGLTWTWAVSATQYRLTVVDSVGVVKDDVATSFGTNAHPQQWVTVRFKTYQSGANVACEVGWYPQSGMFWGFAIIPFAGAVGRPLGWAAGPMGGAQLGHVLALAGTTDDLQAYGYVAAFNGYDGETAGARFDRLCAQEGIPRIVVGDIAKTERMGPQSPGTLMTQFKEIAATEDGLIYDRRTVRGVEFRTRLNRLNQAPALALTYPDDIARPFRKVIDDLDIANVVTVSQANGGDATAQLTTGPLTVAEVGELRETVDVNVEWEASLQLLAGYWLNRRTLTGARFTSVTLDIDAHPELAAAGELDPGDLITIDGYRPEQIRLAVIGIATSTASHRRTVTLTTVPADMFDSGKYGANRYDARGSYLAPGPLAGSAWSATATALTVWTPIDTWSTTSEPYDLMIAGELVRVTSAAAPAGGQQVLTVQRSVNGVVKQLPHLADVRLWPFARYAR